MTFEEITASALTGGAVGAAVVYVARSWISERIRQSIAHEYNRLLETYKSELQLRSDAALERLRADSARDQEMRALATTSFAESHRSAHERRLQGIEALWIEMCRLRRDMPSVVATTQWVSDSEYDLYFSHESLKAALDEIDEKTMTKRLVTSEDLERHRPFVGEYLWWVFFAYRSIIGRIELLFIWGRNDRKITPWKDDPLVNQTLEAVIGRESLDQIRSQPLGGAPALLTLVDRRFLEQAAKVISGEASVDMGLEQARRIASATTRSDAASHGVQVR